MIAQFFWTIGDAVALVIITGLLVSGAVVLLIIKADKAIVMRRKRRERKSGDV